LERSTDDRERCTAMVAALSVELGWHLRLDQQETFISALLQYLPLSYSDVDLRLLTVRYHQDHATVEALRDQNSSTYAVVWKQWCDEALRILRHRRFGSDDPLASEEDLAQIALEELLHALPSFQYASRFSTWAYSVISHSVQRYLRHHRAAKRSGQTESLDQREELAVLSAEAERPDTQAEFHELVALIDLVLSKQADQRLAEIFSLWAYEDQRLVDIARSVHLSPSRVSVLIGQACQILQQSPTILAWLGSNTPEDMQQSLTRVLGRTNDSLNRYT
jgi:RNA polymerase sigma factor (sigma-70 family)